MLETARRQYLQAMGISLWLPRQELAHAAPSRLLPLAGAIHSGPDEERLAIAAAVAQHHASALLQAREPDDAFVNNVGSETKSPRPAPESGIIVRSEPQPLLATGAVMAVTSEATGHDAQSHVPADLTPPRFELCFVRVGGSGVWVCDRRDEVADIQQLALRVAAVMGIPQLQPEMLGFRWPFIDNDREDQSTPVALQALKAQWQYLRSQNCEYVVALGVDATRWLAQASIPGFMVSVTVAEVLASADHKRSLWHFLAGKSRP